MKIHSIALCRVSTAEQATEGHSLDRQEESVIKASQLLEAPIAKTWSLSQSSRSGKNLNRKDLKEMIEFCKRDKTVKYLIVDEVDRFMRDIKYFYYFEAVFEQHGVKVWYASQPELNSDNMMAKLNKLFLVFRAEASNDERISKTISGQKRQARLGYYPFAFHPGYQKGLTPGLHVPHQPKFSLIQKAIREVLSRKYTISQAVNRLNENGFRTNYGYKMKMDKFMKILKCPYYAGAIHIKPYEIFVEKGLHEPMISMAEFNELQDIVSNRKNKFHRKTHNPKYPLSALMLCGGCSEQNKLVGFDQNNGKGKIYEKYRCRNCGKQFKKTVVHSELDRLFQDIRLDGNKEKSFKSALESVWRDEQKENVDYIQRLESRKVELDHKKDALIAAIIDNPDLAEDIKLSISKIKEEIKLVDDKIGEAKNISNDLVQFIDFSLGFVNNLQDNWWRLDHDDRLKCKQLLFPRGFFINHKEKVYTPEISPIYWFVSTKKGVPDTEKNHLVELRGIAPLSKEKLITILDKLKICFRFFVHLPKQSQ